MFDRFRTQFVNVLVLKMTLVSSYVLELPRITEVFIKQALSVTTEVLEIWFVAAPVP